MSEIVEKRRLLDLDLLPSDRDAPIVKTQLSMIPQFVSILTRNQEVLSCGGLVVDVIKTFGKVPSK